MTEYWRSPSREGKWKDGKGHVVLSAVDWYNTKWFDLRIMNMHREEGQNTHTRHGVRLTLAQAKEMLPVLLRMVEEIEDEVERNDRKSVP